MERTEAWALLTKYNKDHFHLQHALTVEAVMRWYANELGYGDEADFWAAVGLLHDLDFEQWPEQHCQKCQELMRDAGVDARTIHAVASHGYGICCDIAPEHEMEKVLFAADELTGLIWAAALMRPSKSTTDMELKSVKKKFKDKKFAAGAGHADRADAHRDAGHRGRRRREDRGAGLSPRPGVCTTEIGRDPC